MTAFGERTTANEIAAVLSDQIAGKTILITGVSPGGLGAETAFSIATQKPGLIILASRDLSKVAETAATIEERYPGTPTRALKLDLASLAAVREAAKEVNTYTENIDVLINNAGVMACPYSTTVDGFETQFATNHLGHFLFTVLILGKLTKETGRVVNVSSEGHQQCGVRFDDIGFSGGEKYAPWEAYGQAKTANILFSVELARRGVRSFSLTPGVIFTNLGRQLPPDDLRALVERMERKNEVKTPQEGTATTMVAAFEPSLLPEHNGAYLEHCVPTPAAEYASNPENAKRLWELSEQLVGVKAEI